MRKTLLVVASVALAACSGTNGNGDGGTGGGTSGGLVTGGTSGNQKLTLTTVTPAHGPPGGGTRVAIAGSGFGSGINVTFGGQGAQSIALISSSQLTAVTPPGAPGPIDVVASLGNQTASLDGGYSYDSAPPIDYCVLQFPKTLNATPESSAGPVYGRVNVPNITTAAGNQSEIMGEAGWGPSGSVPDDTWNWSPASFNTSCSSCGQNYEYESTIYTGTAGSYALAFRFSTDQGQSWVNCDGTGDTAPATYNPADQGTLTVAALPDGGGDGGSDGGLSIDYCDLQFPTTLNTAPGVPSGLVYGRVWVPGLTDSAGNPALIDAQVGFGPAGSVPSSDGGWIWANAAYNDSCNGCGNNYEFDGAFTAPGPGSYAMAYRFSLDRGLDWVDCDTAGDRPYEPSNAGVMTVEVADSGVQSGPSIGWCDLQFPDTLDGVTGSVVGPVYGRVWVAGLTDSGGDAGEILAEVGYGPIGGNPALADGGWHWAQSAYNPACSGCGNNYEYDGTLTAPSPGNYSLAYRFSTNNGATFTDCDIMGDVPYNPEYSGQFDVAAPVPDAGPDAGSAAFDAGPDAGPDAGADAGPDAGPIDAGPLPIPIQYCDLQFPTALGLEPGTNSGLVYGRVYSNGVTNIAGNQAEILAQVGYGPAGSDPADAGWTWSAAAFNPTCTGCGNNYEYDGTFTAPGVGSYSLATRFSGDQGQTWTDCDSAGDAPYNPTNAGTLNVQWITVGWCDLQFPPTLTGEPGVDAGPIYGRVYQAGVTDDGGNPGAILAEVGLGPTGSDPTSPDAGWVWTASTYNTTCTGCGNNYEYYGFVVPLDAGTYEYVTRFSADNGAYWTACGLGGPWSAAGGNDAGSLTVP